MRELALRHFDTAVISGRQSWIHPKNPDVRLYVAPPHGKEETSVRFAMWTIVYAVRIMFLNNRLSSSRYIGLWHEQQVSIVSFGYKGSSEGMPVQGDSSHEQGQTINRASLPDRNFDTAAFMFTMKSGTALNAEDQLSASVEYLSKSIDRRDLLLALIWLLVKLAPHNREPLTQFSSTLGTFMSLVTTSGIEAKQTQYQMTKGDIISMFAYFPEMLLEAPDAFREMNVVVKEKDHDIVVAWGSFRARPMHGLALSPSAANVTMA